MIDWDFIESLEGFTTTGCIPKVDDGGAESGVTIGSGVDLGYWTEAQLLRRRTPAAVIDKVRPYLGLTGRAAELAHVKQNLVLTRDEAEQLTRTIRANIVDSLVNRFDRISRIPFDHLPNVAQTVIASVAFQYGPFLSKATPNFWRQVTRQDWAAAYKNLMNFGDAYRTRRRREASYLLELLR